MSIFLITLYFNLTFLNRLPLRLTIPSSKASISCYIKRPSHYRILHLHSLQSSKTTFEQIIFITMNSQTSSSTITNVILAAIIIITQSLDAILHTITMSAQAVESLLGLSVVQLQF